ncbi:autotransporter outer membrane beta-barrel domain-containing protein [Microvirga alba]|uniref:Autotransporter domain-containing protein n=1 Tax=Microvirga alba TaxID=2791025 RepID=A0A931BT05_9HYPH|nr:autotransporter domain-containing protein [Microvirga alba]MBF9234138.1 autotransporter domain-containing protein [Microvirga alba]
MRQSSHTLIEPGPKGSMQTLEPNAPFSHAALLVSASTAVLALLMGAAQAIPPNTVVQGAPVTVPGTQSSPWDIPNNLMVGNTLDGTLTIESGGQVRGITARVGSDNVTGTVSVQDANSVWTNTGAITIGTGAVGVGFLNILNGGSVSNTTGQVGDNAGGTGTVTVSGSGSQWTNSQTLVVGWYGNGTVTIANGGAVSAPTTWMGVVPGAQGTLTLSGTAGNRGVLTTGVMAKGLGDGRTGDVTLNLNGGILRASADKTYFLADKADYRYGFAPGDVVIGTGGAFIDSNGHNIGISAALGGAGGLTKLGAGTLTLSGANAYSGGTTISGGTLVANTTSLKGPVLNNAALVFNQPVDGTFSGNISGSGSLTKDGAGALTLTGTNTYTGGTQVNGGTLVIGAPNALAIGPVTFGGGVLRFDYTGALDRPITVSPSGFTVDTNGNAQTMSAPLSGSGPFTKASSGSLNLTGNSPLTGPTSVQAGRLAVNGSLGSSTVTVQNGATLGGNGTIGGLIVQNGGFAAPGNSIGTLRVAGNVLFQPGAIYYVEANAAGQADRIDASGTATLQGGTVQVLAEQGIYSPRTTYTILSATGGVSGRFAAVSSNLAFLTPTLGYGNNDVTLTLARVTEPAPPPIPEQGPQPIVGPPPQPIAFNWVAVTTNQFRPANAIEALGEGNRIFDTVLGQSVAGARQAFDALSGEAHASVAATAMADARIVQSSILGHLRRPFGYDQGASVNGAYAADRPGAQAQPVTISFPALDPRRFSLWGEGFGSWGKVRSSGNAASLDTSTGGFIIGADALISPAYRVGVAGGFTRTSFDIDGRLSSGTNESVFGALYGSAAWGAINLRLGASYAAHDIDTQRIVQFPGFSDAVRTSRGGSTAQAFGEVGYRFDLARVQIEPLVGASILRLRTDGFREDGGAAALIGYGQTYDLGTTTLGVRAEARLSDEVPLTLRGLLGWRHAFGDVKPSALMAFASGASAFTVLGTPIDRDALVAEAGLDWQVSKDIVLGVSYSGQIGSRAQDHALKGNFTWRF